LDEIEIKRKWNGEVVMIITKVRTKTLARKEKDKRNGLGHGNLDKNK
jgi:hypothetical protein